MSRSGRRRRSPRRCPASPTSTSGAPRRSSEAIPASPPGTTAATSARRPDPRRRYRANSQPMSLHYREVRKLSLAPGAHPRRLSFLSAASGLVRVREKLYVIADDELHLGVFGVDGAEPLRLVRLLDGDLPASAKKRKARKPDFEALLLLPASDQSPDGSLL